MASNKCADVGAVVSAVRRPTKLGMSQEGLMFEAAGSCRVWSRKCSRPSRRIGLRLQDGASIGRVCVRTSSMQVPGCVCSRMASPVDFTFVRDHVRAAIGALFCLFRRCMSSCILCRRGEHRPMLRVRLKEDILSRSGGEQRCGTSKTRPYSAARFSICVR